MLKKEIKRLYRDLPLQDATKAAEIKYLYWIDDEEEPVEDNNDDDDDDS